MTREAVDEQLSAWLDDELPPSEVELLARRLSQDQDQDRRALLARYGLIGECLRTGRSPVRSALDLNHRVAAALDSADVPAANPGRLVTPRAGRRWFAVAAAAALAAVLLSVQQGSPPAPAPTLQSAALTSTLVIPAARSRIDGPAEANLSPHRLTSYLVRHGEYSGFLSAKLTDSHIVNNRAYSRLTSVPETNAR